MIQINKSRNIFLVVAASVLVLVILTAGLILSQRMASAAPATINVTMFTHEDSHPDLGDGCSLYEASIAASTASAYGGCEPGSVDGTTIVLGVGDYITGIDDTSIDIELDNASLVGAGRDDTVLDGYAITLSGDDETSMGNLTLTWSHELLGLDGVRIYVDGSNKTIDSVLLRDSVSTAYLVIDRNDLTVSNVTVRNVQFDTLGQSVLRCAGDCLSITVDNIDMSASQGMSAVDLEGAIGSAVSDAYMTAHSSASLSVGPDSSISNLDMHIPVCGSITLALGEGAVVDGLSQTMGQGCGMSIYGDADKLTNVYQSMPGTVSSSLNAREVSNYEVDAGGFYWTNNYLGSDVSDITVNVSSMGASLNLEASELSDIDIVGSGTSLLVVDLGGAYDGAKVKNVSMKNQNAGTILDIDSRDVSIDGLTMDGNTTGSYSGILLNDAGSSSISNLSAEGSGVYIVNPVDLVLENLNIHGFNFNNSAAYSESIGVQGLTGKATMRNVNIADSKGGIFVGGTESSELAIDNVQIENIINPAGEAHEAIALHGVGRSSIRSTTISRALTNSTDQSSSVVSIVDGLEHFIVNMTISNSNSGITAVGGDDVNVSLNNVTIANNEDGPAHSSSNPYALRSYGLGTLNINNSIIGGSSPYTGCFNDGATLNIANSIATHESCADFGATVVPSLEGVLATSLAGNGSLGNAQTLALLPGDNPALLAGDSSTCEATDARGVNRPDGQCDLGAFQLSSVSQDEGGGTGTGTPSPNAPDSGLERSDSSPAVPALVAIVMLITAVGVYRRLT